MVDLLQRLSVGLSGVGNSPQDIQRLAKMFEDAGFYSVAAGDSTFDSFTLCAAMACATDRVRIKTGVALWGRTPVQTAFASATLDELSNGRFHLGLGPGPKSRSENWHDVSYDRVVARFRDYVQAIREAWKGRPGKYVSYDGPFYRFKDFALFREPTTDRLEIELAANGKQMVAMAGQVADRVQLNNMHGGRYLREVVAPTIRSAEAKAGRPAGSCKIGGIFTVCVADSKEEAIEFARPALTYNLAIPYNRDVLDWYGMHDERERIEAAIATGDESRFVAAITDQVVETFVVCGTAEECRATVSSYGDILDEASLNTPSWRYRGAEGEAGYHMLAKTFGA